MITIFKISVVTIYQLLYTNFVLTILSTVQQHGNEVQNAQEAY